jgi:hypothetical protein
LTLEEACNRYTLTIEEFRVWERLIDRHGLAGLRTTLTQQYRRPSKRNLNPVDRQALATRGLPTYASRLIG